MREKLNHELITNLVKEGYFYKDIVEITGYKKDSVYGFCWKHFGKLKDRQACRRQSIPLTQEEKEFIFGTLMGDGNLTKCGNNSIYGRTNHSIKQETYCKYKQNKLKNLTYSVSYSESSIKKLNKKYPQCYFCFKPNTELIPLYEMFYNKGKKDVPEDLSLLTPRAMAWWFMDDGTSSSKCSISIATCSFSLEGLLRLQKFLKDTYDLEVIIQKDFKLYFSSDSARKFYNLVKDYIIDDMLYKFKFVNPELLV